MVFFSGQGAKWQPRAARSRKDYERSARRHKALGKEVGWRAPKSAFNNLKMEL